MVTLATKDKEGREQQIQAHLGLSRELKASSDNLVKPFLQAKVKRAGVIVRRIQHHGTELAQHEDLIPNIKTNRTKHLFIVIKPRISY